MIPSNNRLRKHSQYQRVYRASRKNFGRLFVYFYRFREPPDTVGRGAAELSNPRIGLTVGKVMGKAVKRNRIKRRVREAVRSQLAVLENPVDIVLHPGRRVLESSFSDLQSDIASIFSAIAAASRRQKRSNGIPSQ